MAFARAVQGSNSIEGYNASLDDVVAAVEGEPTLDAYGETQLALAGYRDAMTYVLQIAGDEGLEVDEGLRKSLHFMMMRHDLPTSFRSELCSDVAPRPRSSGSAGLAMAGEEISNQSASRDLMRMVDLGLLRTVGERRAPFEIVRERRQLSLT
jgi:hypothetical protein